MTTSNYKQLVCQSIYIILTWLVKKKDSQLIIRVVPLHFCLSPPTFTPYSPTHLSAAHLTALMETFQL